MVIFAEWRARTEETDEDGDTTVDEFNEEAYQTALALAQTLPFDVMADDIWDRMSEQATCTNGGWEAHCCPFGCACHMVSFDVEDEHTTTATELVGSLWHSDAGNDWRVIRSKGRRVKVEHETEKHTHWWDYTSIVGAAGMTRIS